MGTYYNVACKKCGGSISKINTSYFCHLCKTWYGPNEAKGLLVETERALDVDNLFTDCVIVAHEEEPWPELERDLNDIIAMDPNNWMALFCLAACMGCWTNPNDFTRYALNAGVFIPRAIDVAMATSPSTNVALERMKDMLTKADKILWMKWVRSRPAKKDTSEDATNRLATTSSCFLTAREAIRLKFEEYEGLFASDFTEEYNALMHFFLGSEIRLCEAANRPELCKKLRKTAKALCK